MIAAAGRALALVSTVSGVVIAVPAAYLATISISGLLARRGRSSPTARVPETRFQILVPAHDEETVIGEALAAFDRLDYPTELFGVHVVADNCTDRTADVVAAGQWSVHRRDDQENPGKGPALNWLFDRVTASGRPFDAAVIVDADASLDPDFLRAMDAAVQDGARVAQGYYAVRNPEPSPAASFRYAALACRHRLRPLGRTRLGGSAGLYGCGMTFERSVLAERRWSGHLVEDAELQNELLLDGILVTFVPDAVVLAEIPDSNDAARTQNERWEKGRIDLARRFVPHLMRSLPRARSRRIATVDAVLDHLTPPLSTVVVAGLIGGATSSAAAMAGQRSGRRLAVVHVAALGVVAAHTVAGLVSAGADPRHLRALSAAPVQIAWKARLWASMLVTRRDVAWVRTRRNAETGTSS